MCGCVRGYSIAATRASANWHAFNCIVMNLVSALLSAAKSNSSGITFVPAGGEEQHVSYANLYEQAMRVLGALQQQGIGAGDEVVIRVADNRKLLCVFWSCMLGGMVPVPLSAENYPAHKLRILKLWKYLRNAYWIGEQQDLESVRAAAAAAGAGHSFSELAARFTPVDALLQSNAQGAMATVTEDDIAYVQFSSGSTGDPKGVCLTHRNLLFNVQDIIRSLGITGNDVLLSWMPLTHDMGFIGFHLTGLFMNIHAVSMPAALFVKRPLLWMDKAHQHRCSVLYSPNFGLHYFSKALERSGQMDWDLSCVRLVVNGAEPIDVALCRQFSKRLEQYGFSQTAVTSAYGLAEASVAVSVMPLQTPVEVCFVHRDYLSMGDEIQLLDKADADAAGFADVGYPVSTCRVRICDAQDRELHERFIGQVQIKGPNVTAGYYNNDEATAKVFTADGWLKTGDLGFFQNGRLVITGRLKDIIIINGQNYYPTDIEQLIINAGVAETGSVAACGVRRQMEQLVIFILHKGSNEAFAAIETGVKHVVFSALGISVDKVIALKKIPKTTSGKIQRYFLAEQYQNGEFNDAAEPNPVQEAVLAIEQLLGLVRELTGRADIQATTRLADMGMNSFLAVQLINRVEQLTGKSIPVPAIFNSNDLASLCELMNAGSNDEQPLPALVPADDAADYPLSEAQKRIWLECTLNPVAYNVPVVHTIKGMPDITLLESCMQVLVARYEILRTSFDLKGAEPRQLVHAYNKKLLWWQVWDLQTGDNKAAAAQAIVHQIIHEPFRLNQPSLLRVGVIKLKNDELLFVLVMHHIITDGWSLSILFDELSNLYNNAGVPDHMNPISQVVYQYRDYCAWQQNLVRTKQYEQARSYWAAELKDLPHPVGLSMNEQPLPGFRQKPAAYYRYELGPAEWDRMKELAAACETTPFVIFMSLLNTLLYRYTNHKDIVIGFDVSGRMLYQLEAMVGYLLNTLLLRTGINGANTFRDVVNSVKHKASLALQHQLYPFEEVLKEQQAQSRHGSTMFKILVLYQDFYNKAEGLQLQDAAARKEPVYVEQGLTDLLLEFTTADGTPDLGVCYNTDLYSGAEMENLVAHFMKLLEQVSMNAAMEIRWYNFLTPRETAFLSPLARKQPERFQLDLPVHRIFEWRASVTPDAPAVTAGNTTLTYRELNERANAVAWYIKEHYAVLPDDGVGFMVDRNEHIAIAILAILKSGAAYLPMDAELPAARCESIIADSAMKCLLTDAANFQKSSELLSISQVVKLDNISMHIPSIENPLFAGNQDNLAYIIYTSGSTGVPKGVMIGHRTLSFYVQQFIREFGVAKMDCVVQQASVAFDTLAEELFPALCTSAHVVIDPGSGRDVDGLLSLIHQHKVTVLSTTPLVLKEINRKPDHRINSLRLIISGGDVLHPSYINNLLNSAEVYNTYGPSETTVCATWNKITGAENASAIGKPVYGYDIWIMDENLQLLPPGKTGEICIEGGLAKGYLNLPLLTAEKFFVPDFDTTKVLYRSGDYGCWKQDGTIAFSGRMDNQVKFHGYRIELEEIERTINRYKGVECALVLTDGEQLVAFILADEYFSANGLRAWIGKQLPYYMIPGRIELLDKIPVTVTGKTDRQALMRKLRQVKQTAVYREPLNDMERHLQQMLQGILEVHSMSTDSNFFDLGCDSIKASRLVNGIYRETGFSIRLSDIFIYPTIQQLSALLEQYAAENAGSYIIELE